MPGRPRPAAPSRSGQPGAPARGSGRAGRSGSPGPVHVGSAASAACAARSSHGSSVVASTAIRNRSNSARGPEAGLGEPRRRAGRRSRPPCRADGAPVTPKISASSSLQPVAGPACRGTRPSARTAAARPPATAASASGPCADAERVERHAGRVQQARHVVVGGDEQRRRVGERARPRAAARGSTWPCGETTGARARCSYSRRRDRAGSPGRPGSSRSGWSASTVVGWRPSPV